MLTCQTCYVGVPAECGSYSLMFVGGHADTVACRADGDSEVLFAILNGLSQGVSEVGIVATLGRETAEVTHHSVVVLEPFDNFEFEVIACVVRRYSYEHF